jgi:transposase
MNRVFRKLSGDECLEVATLAGERYSHRARFGISQSTISRVMQRYRETGVLDKEDIGPQHQHRTDI